MTADIKSDNAPVSITERYAQLGKGLRESRIADGRVTAGDGVGQPVGADAYKRRLEEVDKGIQERAAGRIGRNNPESIKY